MAINTSVLQDFRRVVLNMSDHNRDVIIAYLGELKSEAVLAWSQSDTNDESQALKGGYQMLNALQHEFETPTRVQDQKARHRKDPEAKA